MVVEQAALCPLLVLLACVRVCVCVRACACAPVCLTHTGLVTDSINNRVQGSLGVHWVTGRLQAEQLVRF